LAALVTFLIGWVGAVHEFRSRAADFGVDGPGGQINLKEALILTALSTATARPILAAEAGLTGCAILWARGGAPPLDARFVVPLPPGFVDFGFGGLSEGGHLVPKERGPEQRAQCSAPGSGSSQYPNECVEVLPIHGRAFEITAV
jgi:hypothetical protein